MGEELKKFNTRDAKGLELIRNSGIEVAIMTSEDSSIVRARAEKLDLEHVFLGVKDKISLLKKFSKKSGIEMSHIAFMGDDLNDLSCMENVGVSACPSDAMEEIKRIATYVSRHKGGRGAVREFCDWLLGNSLT
jgi:N-acylneuraminate cytidylyltransferase